MGGKLCTNSAPLPLLCLLAATQTPVNAREQRLLFFARSNPASREFDTVQLHVGEDACRVLVKMQKCLRLQVEDARLALPQRQSPAQLPEQWR